MSRKVAPKPTPSRLAVDERAAYRSCVKDADARRISTLAIVMAQLGARCEPLQKELKDLQLKFQKYNAEFQALLKKCADKTYDLHEPEPEPEVQCTDAEEAE